MKLYILIFATSFFGVSCSSNGSNPSTPIGEDIFTVSSVSNASVVFDIVEGNLVTLISDVVRLRYQAVLQLPYALFSTELDPETLREVKTYECPESGTISVITYSYSGLGHYVELSADGCGESGDILHGEFEIINQLGRGKFSNKRITLIRQATLIRNNGNYIAELTAGRVSVPIPRNGKDIWPYTDGIVVDGTNLSLSENGESTYTVGSLGVFQFDSTMALPDGKLGFTVKATNIVSADFDIDEIVIITPFKKSTTSRYYVSGSFQGNANGIEILKINADTGNENTFMIITKYGGSTMSEIHKWDVGLRFGDFISR